MGIQTHIELRRAVVKLLVSQQRHISYPMIHAHIVRASIVSTAVPIDS